MTLGPNRPDVPLQGDATERFLPWLLAFMVYLAGLTLASTMAISNVVGQWDVDLDGELTIQLPPQAETEDAGEEPLLDRVRPILDNEPGVDSVREMDDAEMTALLEPWLGTAALDQDLPLPQILVVEIDGSNPPNLSGLQSRLAKIDPGIVLDDHQRWLGGLLSLARTIQAIALAITLAITAISIVAVVFVTRTGLSVHRPVIELLHLIGAQDDYIARQFQWHALKLGLRGGLFGLGLVAATLIPIGFLLSDTGIGLMPTISLTWWEWIVLLLLPLLSALVAMLTARATVLSTLSGKP